MSFIRVQHVTKRFGRVLALDALSLDIAYGEFITLLGPSGCGKTTALRTLAGFEEPDDGTIIVEGRQLSAPRSLVPPERRDMGMVFQNYALWPHMRVYDNVAYGLRLRRFSASDVRARVQQTLERLGLSTLATRYPHELSGGQQQRVALARAMIAQPRILLLDEPLSNLDAALRGQARLELKRLQVETQSTFVYVTHDQSEALAMSHRIAVLDRGRVVETGAPMELYARPRSLVAARALGAVNVLSGRVAARFDGGYRLQMRGDLELCIVVESDADLDGKAEMMVIVRPEQIVTHDIPYDASNTFDGTVSQTAFLGDRIELEVECLFGRLQMRAPARIPVPTGDRIRFFVPPSACSVVRLE